MINHGDDLAGGDNFKLKRFPNVVREFFIKSRDMTIATPHGGILYFRIDKKSNEAEPLTFLIEGAYELPYFNEELHT